MTDTPQDKARAVIDWATGLIPHEGMAGLLFGVVLIVTDHVFNLIRKV